METNLRQAKADIEVTGIVAEKVLEVSEEKGIKRISGYLSVKVDETNTIRFNVFANERTLTGAENKVYAGLLTVMYEYKSIAKDGIENADRVHVKGTINPYTDRNGVPRISYRTNFFNRIPGNDYEPQAEFDCELFIKRVRPETDNEGTETGRTIVEGWLPTYNGIEPLSLVTTAEDADAVMDAINAKDTFHLWGEVINSYVEKITEVPARFGKAKQNIERIYRNELVITGGDPYEDDRAYDEETINAAVNEREAQLEARKAGVNSSSNKPSAAARGRNVDLGW